MARRIKTIGITIGDPGGIGPEVTARALSRPDVARLGRFTVIGDAGAYTKGRYKLPQRCSLIDHGHFDGIKISQGKIDRLNGQASLNYLRTAVRLIKNGQLDCLVTAPVSKEAIGLSVPSFHGHTEFLADSFKVKHVGMLFVGGNTRTILATRHLPLNKVSRALTTEKVYQAIVLTHRALKTLFRIRRPRIAVCGLNPHAGEGGTLGKEEETRIIPAIKKAKAQGISCIGPLAADTLFYPDHCCEYDAIVAMYHDQGLTPIKALYFPELVNLTIGLPFIRTSPAHGTAFDIAGQYKADPSSMIEAIKLAASLNRT